MRTIHTLTICYFLSFLSTAQENIRIKHISPQINDIIKLNQAKQANKKIEVYSIQLKSSELPETIKKIKNKYSTLFPAELINEVFEPPYFKIITGAYLDPKIAEKKLQEIQKKFKSAFILKRELTIDEFKRNLESMSP